MTVDNKPTVGYDCLVRNSKGEEATWVSAHYAAGYAYPFRATIWALKCESCTFPVEFLYKDQLIKRCTVTIDLQENHFYIQVKLNKARKIERACWVDNMTDQEKLKVLSNFITNQYTYSEVMCVVGAEYTAFAARDLGLTSLLLYPTDDKDLLTYNIYYNTTVPGGNCACLICHPDSSILRYDVQGGSYWIRKYKK